MKNAFKVTFITADFKENWAEYAGPDAPPPDASNPRYCLRLYVLDAAATDKYDKLSDQLLFWHLLDPMGNIYYCTSGSYYKTDGLYRDLIMIFKCSEPRNGSTRNEPGEMSLATGCQDELIPLEGVPQDVPVLGPEPTPEPLRHLMTCSGQTGCSPPSRQNRSSPGEGSVPCGYAGSRRL